MRKRFFVFLILTLIVFVFTACFAATEQKDPPKSTVSAESIKIEQTSIIAYIGKTETLDVTLQPNDTTDVPTYASSDETIVTVDRHGVVEAISEGEAVITVTVGALKATCRVTAQYPPVEQIEFTQQELNLQVGEEFATELILSPDNAQQEEFTYYSDDERIAVVDDKGVVKAVGVGNTCIYAALASDDSIRCMLDLTTACDAVTDMDFEEPYYSLLAENQKTLPLNIEPFGMHVDDVIWSSSDESVATVDEDGVVTGVSRGRAIITATSEEMQADCIVSVVKRLAPDPINEIADGRYSESNGILKSVDNDESGKAEIMLIGDLMCLSAQQSAAREDGVYNFNSSFSLVKDIFAKSDLNLGNLETLVSYSNSYSGEQKEVNGNPNCNGPATYLDAVKYAGLDALILANNHCADGGEIGIYETLQQLNKYKIPATGLFADADDKRYMIADVNGIQVGIASYTGHVNGGARKISEEQRDIMLNFYTKEKAEADIAAMKKEGAEYILVYIHWGTENTHKVNGKQKQWAQELADAGADFIAGSHPHCLQSCETLTAADGRKVFCAYSLGNFVSSMGRTINNDTVIIDLKLVKQDGKVTMEDVGYIGCRVIGSYNGGHHVVVPTAPELNGGDESSALQSAQERIADVMDGTIKEITSLG